MAVKFDGNVKDDPVIKNLLQNMPEEVRQSFTEVQLSHLKTAVASRQWGHHAIDFRGTLRGIRHRYYYVFVAGKNQRMLSRHEQKFSRFLSASLLTLFVLISALLGLLVLYLIKSALGINLFEDFSLGLWTWLNN